MERNDPAAAAADNGGDALAGIVVEETPAEGATEAAVESPNAARARQLGWRPQEEYRGPKDKWIDADQFIEKTEREVPVMRERLRTLGSENERLKRENADFKRREDEGWGEMVQRSREAEARGYEYAVGTVKAKMREAVQNADQAAYDKLEDELKHLEKMRPSAPPKRETTSTANRPADPDVEYWVQQNPWFKADKRLNKIAIGLEADLMEDEPFLSTSDRLKKVREEIEKRFPEKFGNPARSAAPTTARPGPQAARGPIRPKQKTEADLPPSARSTMERLVKQKVLTKEQYLKDYPWDT